MKANTRIKIDLYILSHSTLNIIFNQYFLISNNYKNIFIPLKSILKWKIQPDYENSNIN